MNEQALEYIRNIRLIDDSFFEVFFKGDPKYIEVVIHEIFKQLGHPLVKIQEVSVQEDLNALDKRTVRLDALATDEEGNLINIEVQRSVSSVLTKRARYHSALLDTNSLERSSGFDALAETYVIFITEKDYRGKGLPAYQVERLYLEDKTPFGDGTHIIFVNGEYRGDDAIGNLICYLPFVQAALFFVQFLNKRNFCNVRASEEILIKMQSQRSISANLISKHAC